MRVDIKILDEIQRYNQINRYINEQDVPPPPPPPADPAAGVPPPPPPPDAGAALPPPPGAPADVAAGDVPPPQPVDTENDPDVEKVEIGRAHV